ncbi:MAG: hypothetical protein V7675_10460 [Hyphomonas sp.]|uniref:hypothetical protein n=1 Tax=Hyphomonas TaxID=85 RepID=UPI000A48DB04|nr:hypothetical protein [Hyphomonas oceanitis]
MPAAPFGAGLSFCGFWFGLELPSQQHPILAEGFAFDVRAWAPVSVAAILLTWRMVISFDWTPAG